MPLQSPFASWQKLNPLSSSYEEAIRLATGPLKGIYEDRYSISASEKAWYMFGPFEGNMAIPRGYDKLPGLVNVGTTTYAVPGWHVSAEGAIVRAEDAALDAMRGEVGIKGMKRAGWRILNAGRSVTESTLGTDYSLAFQRSQQINVRNLRASIRSQRFAGISMQGGTRPIGEILSDFDQAARNYMMGGEKLAYKSEIEKFWGEFQGGIEGMGIGDGRSIHLSAVKDSLFRKYGVASMLSATDIGFNVTPQAIGKSLHQWAKIKDFDLRQMGKLGLMTPAATGLAFNAESEYISRLAAYDTGRVTPRAARFGANVFYAVGGGGALADARAMGGSRVFNLSRLQGMKRHSKDILLGGEIGQNLDSLDIHNQLRRDVVNVLEADQRGAVPSGMRKTKTGKYLYKGRGQYITRSGQWDNEIDFFLGRNRPSSYVGQIPNEDDIRRSMVGAEAHGAGIRVKGYKLLGKDDLTLRILYESGHRPMTSASGKLNETAMIVAGQRVMTQSTPWSMQTASGRAVDMIVRGQDFGLGRNTISAGFASQVMGAYAAEARAAGQLGAFHKFLGGAKSGLEYVPGKGRIGGYVGWTSPLEASGNNLFRNISRVLSASPGQRAALGITPETAGVLRVNSAGQLSAGPFTETVRHGGFEYMGAMLPGQETSIRSGVIREAKIRSGGLSMRLHDIATIAREQASGIKEPGVRAAYGRVQGVVEGLINQGSIGRIGSADVVLPPAIKEVRSVASALAGRARGATSIGAWLSGGGVPLTGNLSESRSMMARTLLSSQLEGRGGRVGIHSLGGKYGPYKGEVIQLPKPVDFLVGEGKLSTSQIPFTSSKYIGISPAAEGTYLRSKVQGLRLGKLKEELASIMTEEGAMIKAGKYSTRFTEAARDYLSALGAASVNKHGLLYKNLVGNPAATFTGGVVNYGSIRTSLTAAEKLSSLGMSPKMARKFFRAAGYNSAAANAKVSRIMSGAETYSLGAVRYPVYQGQNLQYLNMRIHRGMAHDVMALSEDVIRMMKGDFDKDMIEAFILQKGQTGDLNKMVAHRSAFLGQYSKIVATEEEKIFSGLGLTRDAALKEEINMALGARAGSAAGGGMFVGSAHMGYVRYQAYAHALTGKEGAGWMKTLGQHVDPGLMKQVRALSADTGYLGAMGFTAETGAYGVLKKGSTGATLDLLMDMGRYGKGEISKQGLQRSVYNMFLGSIESGNINIHDVPGYSLAQKYQKTTAAKLTNLVMGRGTSHEGLGTLAKMRVTLRNLGVSDPSVELARGRTPSGSNAAQQVGRKVLSMLEAYGEFAGDANVLPLSSASDAAAQSKMLTSMAKAADDTYGRSTMDRVTDAMDQPAPPAWDGVRSRFRNMMGGRWGKRAIIGASVILGIGAIDAMFGSGGEEPSPTMYGGGAPLPPTLDIGQGDANMDIPSAESFASRASAPARIERPYVQRHQFNVVGTAGDSADFGYLTHGHMGNAGIPTRDGYIYDASDRDLEIDELIRSRLRSSF